MAEALVSAVLTQLTTIVSQEAEQEIRLILRVEEFRKLVSKFEAIKVVLVDAETKQLEFPSVREWCDKVKNLAYDMENALDEWSTLILKRQSITWKNKVCWFFTSLCDCFGKLSFGHDVAHKIKTLIEKLDDLVLEGQLYNVCETTNVVDATIYSLEISTTPLIDVSEIEGRDEEISTLVNKLLSGSGEGGKDLHVISLVGKGGIGKTTLAKFAYNHDEIVNGFEKRGWVCVSEPFDKIRIAQAIIQELKGRASSLNELGSLLNEILKCIKGKRFLLVLDDLWTKNLNYLEDLFLCLKKGLAGSKVLVTTRNHRVASLFRSDILSVEELSETACWSLFARLAFSQRSTWDHEKFWEIGRKILAKCRGSPLAAKALGSLLRYKETIEEWQRILESEIWKLEFDKGPLLSLLLSYNYLPYTVKRCFSYCAVFPKGYEMVKDDLIRLWMAQGYLASEHNQALEMTGNLYFNILARYSFFQECHRDKYGNILCCKMHDIVYDLAQYLTQNECLTVGFNGYVNPSMAQFSYENTRHAMIKLTNRHSLSISYVNSETLLSLLVEYDRSCDTRIREIVNIDQLKSLKALKLVSRHSYHVLDPDIMKKLRNLIKLKYFDVSMSRRLKELPEELCELYNLQTLNVFGCINLEKLPQGIEKLSNLRHLINSDTFRINYMPKGIEKLTHLRTLNEFVVSDSNHAEAASSLESLKYIKNLQGSLWIRRLGNVRYVNEAKEAELHNKTKLTALNLWFDASNEEESARTAEDDEQLLEALQPLPRYLQQLVINYYRGKCIFYIWLTQLTQLRELDIYNCKNLEYLPSLGKLSSLDSLGFYNAWRVKTVSTEFLGIESGILTSPSSASSITAFPKLTSLQFYNMLEWEEWDYGIIGKNENIQIMPSLGSLEIHDCPKLKALPDHLFLNASLKKIEIVGGCPLLYSYLKKRGQQWPPNFHIPEISYFGSTEDDFVPAKYKSVVDPKEHKFEFECLGRW